MPVPHSDLLTLDEVAAQFAVSKRTVTRWIEAGDLIACRIGRVIRIRNEDLQRFIKQHSK